MKTLFSLVLISLIGNLTVLGQSTPLFELAQSQGLLPKTVSPDQVLRAEQSDKYALLILKEEVSIAETEPYSHPCLLLVVENGQILQHRWASALDADDFYLASVADQTVFAYYSSPVGYTQYHYFDAAEGRYMIGRKIGQNEQFSWEELNFQPWEEKNIAHP